MLAIALWSPVLTALNAAFCHDGANPRGCRRAGGSTDRIGLCRYLVGARTCPSEVRLADRPPADTKKPDVDAENLNPRDEPKFGTLKPMLHVSGRLQRFSTDSIDQFSNFSSDLR